MVLDAHQPIRRTLVSIALGLALTPGCRPDMPTAPATLAKGGAKSPVTVVAAEPDTIPTDTTLTVTIYGSGFVAGAKVEYLFNSAVSPSVVATAVQVVSETSLLATTQVARNAAIGTYDLAVWSNGKRGVGVEKIEVVVRTVSLPDYGYESNAFDINDAQVAVGFAWGPSGGPRAVRWMPEGAGWRMEDLGPGVAVSINRWGDIVGFSYDGTTNCPCPAWIRFANGSTADLGPIKPKSPSFNGASLMRVGDDGTVMANFVLPDDRTSFTVRRPISPGVWAPPEPLPAPSGLNAYTYSWDLSPSGEWVGGGAQVSGPGQAFAVSWRWGGNLWTPTFVIPNQAQSIAEVSVVNNSATMAGRIRSCQGAECTSPPTWTLVAWAAPGSPHVTIAGCVPVEYPNPDPKVTDLNEAGQMVGHCNVPERQGSKTRYPVWQLFWTTPATSPVPVSRSGYIWALNDTRIAAGRLGRGKNEIGYCLNPYGQLERSPGVGNCHAALWLLP